uniref:C-type lectin domain-containing protein n=1 Tax=Dicentrarchus labrax TaxID=13489 RepID=A0A8P4KAN1_DICLA
MSVTAGLCAVSSTVGRQYHFIYDLKNMTEAQSYCREHYTDLATIDNMEMSDFHHVCYHLNFDWSSWRRSWIGLYDDMDSWKWSLSDGGFYKHGKFRHWSPREPNNHKGAELCTEMYDNGLWNDNSCEEPLKAVCFDVRGENINE